MGFPIKVSIKLFSIFFLLCVSLISSAQTGSIDGTVIVDSLPTKDVVVKLTDGAVINQSTITGPDGSYTFNELTVGTYTISVLSSSVPSGYVDANDNMTLAGDVTLSFVLSVGANPNLNFSFVDPASSSISGSIINDLNKNGQLDPGELPIPSVIIQLLNSSGGVITQDTTDGTGSYNFTGLNADEYSVAVDLSTIPNGYLLTTIPYPINVDISVGETITGTIIGVADAATSSIRGNVLVDNVSLDGAVVTLSATINGIQFSAVAFTDNYGSYIFTGLVGAVYLITVDANSIPSGFIGNANTSTVLGVGAANTGLNFNFTDPQTSSISGSVFNDFNRNGVLDFPVGEGSFAPVTINLLNSSAAIIDTDVSTNGSYSFTGLSAGAYSIAIDLSTLPNGYIITTMPYPINVDISIGENVSGIMTGVADPATGQISGTVFADSVPVPFAVVRLAYQDRFLNDVDVYTNANFLGEYHFDNLLSVNSTASNSYQISVVSNIPQGYVAEDTGSPLITAWKNVSLAVGEIHSGLDFRFVDPATSSISGSVFNDINGNSIKDVGESGFSSVQISVLKDSNVLATISSLADGSYQFNNLDAGTYEIAINEASGIPNAYMLTGNTSNPSQIDVPLAENRITYFGYRDPATSTVSGSVSIDTIGIANVNVFLTLPDSTIEIALTASDGSFEFNNLIGGSYSLQVDETHPDLIGYVRTSMNPNPVTVLPASSAQSIFVYTDPATASFEVGFWNDKDVNGINNAEPGMPGVTVDLIDVGNGNTIICSITASFTDDGSCRVIDAGISHYRFESLIAGNYAISITDTQNALQAFIPTTFPQSVNKSLTASQIGSPLAFGYYIPNTTQISGTVFNDANGDGAKHLSEAGFNGVAVDLFVGNIYQYSDVTDTDGNYSLAGLGADIEHTIKVDLTTLPDSYIATTPIQFDYIFVSPNETVSSSFGFTDPATASISGTLFNDINQNGIKDVGELSTNNIAVNISKDSIVIATAMSITDGIYEFSNLQAGTYEVTIDMSTIPDGFVVSQPSSKTINLGLASLITNIDLGIIDSATSTISGSVKIDTNPVPNVNVFLTHPDGTRETTLTDPNGVFQFDNLIGADYTLDVDEANDALIGYSRTSTNLNPISLISGGTIISDFVYSDPGTAYFDIDFWIDDNQNGIRDGIDVALSGVTFELIDNSDPGVVLCSITAPFTDDGSCTVLDNPINSSFRLGPLFEGEYSINITDTQGVLSTMLPSMLPMNVTQQIHPGIQNAPFSFGYYQTNQTRINGTVFNDLNANGIIDAIELGGLSGILVTLLVDSEIQNSVFTDSDGNYSFNGLGRNIAHTILVDTSTVEGYFSSSQNPLQYIFTTNIDVFQANFAFQQSAQIGNLIFNDFNGNGVFDGSDVGIGGVTIDLIRDDNANGVIDTGETVVSTQETSFSGFYNFDNLNPGSYIVNVTDTNTLLNGFALTSVSISNAYTVIAADVIDTADFGYQQQDASIGDFVWNDLNGDGVQDGGEPGLPGYTAYLDLNSNGSLDGGEPTDVTDANGAYDFIGLATGNYNVTIDATTIPTGFVLTTSNLPVSVNLAAGEDYNDADFAYQQQNASIGDLIFNDINGDGIQNTGEPGINGVSVDLIDDANGNGELDTGESVITTQFTLDGHYNFSNLVIGDYIVQVTDTDLVLTNFGLTSGANPLAYSLSTGEGFTGADFGFQQQNASIGDFVWNDINGDGIQDGGEPGLTGVTVYLDLNVNGVLDGGEPSSNTDGSGTYDFIGLATGIYSVRIDTSTVVSGFVLTTANNSFLVNLTAGDDFNGADFGYQQQDASIGDFIFNDFNGNGIYEVGEVGINGITINLINDTNGNGAIDSGESVLATQSTNIDGLYNFNGLSLGDYIVDVTDTDSKLTGFIKTAGNDPVLQIIAAGQNIDSVDFGYQQQDASIGDFIFNDLNGNGVEDLGDIGVDGVSVDLIADANGNGEIDTGELVLATELTTDGYYNFNALALGDYIVRVTDTDLVLTGFVLTSNNHPITHSLTTGEDFNLGDFGYQQRSAIIGDLVFNDLNGNGVQDVDDTGIQGVIINLILDHNGNGEIDPEESIIETQVTNSEGFYQFGGLSVGSYIIEVIESLDSLPGVNYVLDGFNLTSNTIASINILTAGEILNVLDFGYQLQTSVLTGLVFNDFDGNTQYDNNEPGIAGVQVNLIKDTNENGLIDADELIYKYDLTDGNGEYAFTDLGIGHYLIQIEGINPVLTGFVITSGTNPINTSINSEQTISDLNFGFQQQDASIGDLVFKDINGNGSYDIDEPGLAGLSIDLINDINGNGVIDETEEVIQTQFTTEEGLYHFNNLSLGSYIVKITDIGSVLNGYRLTLGEDPKVQVLIAGQIVTDVDYGFFLRDRAVDDYVTLFEDSSITSIDVLSNDTNIGSLPREIIAMTQPEFGTATFTANDISYNPNPDYCNDGSELDTLKYTLAGGSDASVNISVTCINDAPGFSIIGDVDVTNLINIFNSTLEISNFAYSYVFGPANEASQNIQQFELEIVSDSSFILNGAFVDNDGSLYLDFSLNYGVAIIHLTMQDNGGVENGGEDTSEVKEFLIYHTDTIFQNSFELVNLNQFKEIIDKVNKNLKKDTLLTIDVIEPSILYFYGYKFDLKESSLSKDLINLLRLWMDEILILESPYGDIDRDGIPNYLDSNSF